MARPVTALDAVLDHLAEQEKTHLKELQDLVRIPSVSADPSYAKDVRKAAEWLARRLRRAGLENVGLVETAGHPAVVADWLHAGDAPTVLVYGHYDVQPAQKSDGWRFDPFEARIEDGRILGRGTTDDKGQSLCHVYAAEAWIKNGGPPVNLKMVFEGEEESGSVNFPEVLDKTGDRLRADLLVVSDSMMRGEGRPAITYSLRGLTYLQVDVQGPRGDLHSGTWGGVVWNPIEALCHMLASCKDPKTGKVRVKGFYDDVVRPSKTERATIKEHGEADEDLRRGAGVDALFGESGWSAQERIGVRPTFEVNGIWGGYTGAGSKTVIPATAHAKVSCRLVADQKPEVIAAAVERHLLAMAPEGVRAAVRTLNDGDAVRADPGHPLVKAVGKALGDAFGQPAVPLPEGGSIPAVADMQQRLGAIPVLAGFGNRDENMHAPEESFRVDSFVRGRIACARMLAEVAATGR